MREIRQSGSEGGAKLTFVPTPIFALPVSCPDLHFAGTAIGPRVIRYCRDIDGLSFRRLIHIKTFAFDWVLANNLTAQRDNSIQQFFCVHRPKLFFRRNDQPVEIGSVICLF